MIVGGLRDEMDAKIRTDKTGAAGDNNCLHHVTERNGTERNARKERNRTEGTEWNVITYINYYLNSV